MSVFAVCAWSIWGASPGFADSPLGKTVDFTYRICVPSRNQCVAPTHIHNYVSESGHVFAFSSATGGRKSELGKTFASGNNLGQFNVEGDALVFSAVLRQNENVLSARIVVQIAGGRCSLSGTAIFNGQPLDIDIQTGPCRVYKGRKAF